jgi:predicted HicB family RNase H-like nuclease
MSNMREQCVYVAGPYKGYCGRAEYDDEAKFFHGEVIGTRDVITFQGTSIPELHDAFKSSVDDYLSFCKERGEPAEKPFSGKFVARLEPDLHRRVSMLAQAEGKSLNQLICDCLERLVQAVESGSCVPTLSLAPPADKGKGRRTSEPKRKKRSHKREYA